MLNSDSKFGELYRKHMQKIVDKIALGSSF